MDDSAITIVAITNHGTCRLHARKSGVESAVGAALAAIPRMSQLKLLLGRSYGRSHRRLLKSEDGGSVLVNQLNDSTAAAGNAGHRFVGNNDRQPGLFHDQLVDIPQLGAAPG